MISISSGALTKNFCHDKRILAIEGEGEGGGGDLSESKICDENLFSDNVEWSSKDLWKMISADVKANKNNKK